MAEIHFYLNTSRADKDGKVQLLAQVAVNYKKYRKYIGKLKKEDWSSRSKRLRLPSNDDKRYKDNLSLNELIDTIEARAKKMFHEALVEKRKITEREIQELFYIPENDEASVVLSFYEVFEEFIKANKGDKANRTIMGYTTTLNYLKTFEKTTGQKVDWNTLNIRLLDNLKSYHFEVIEKQTGYFAKIQRVLKTFLKWAEKRNFYSGDLYKEFDEKEPEKEVVFLTLEELMLLFNFEFKSERLSKTRDLFCFSSFTGLRYSDVVSLKKEHIGEGFYYKTQKKTSEVVKNPINTFAQQILEKYKDCETPLPRMSTQKLNEYVKECCNEIAKKQKEEEGFNKTMIKTIVLGGKTNEKKIPKYKAVTFHTARKTFITNSMAMGMNIKVLQEMGAPKRDKDLRKYLKVSDDLKAVAMEQTWNKLVN